MEKYDELLVSIRKIIRSIDLHSKKLNKDSGLTGPQLLVLQAVKRTDGITAKAIADSVNLSQGTITTILDRLATKGAINRVRSETDRRRISIYLTDNGQTLLNDSPKPLQDYFIERFQALETWEQNQLLSSVGRIAKMMDASELDAAPLLEIGAIVDSEKEDK
ncbi:MarR family winged helix-turn-helix transcriptional regulator [Aliikangiella sp. IMCC44359]|uniref:MarR family winged helix-turn-helix transcriptional regulator n=1 Tax=Aliikangiella sp. IMCC44359 TaxID=3459125 RepID=UPI00403A9C91